MVLIGRREGEKEGRRGGGGSWEGGGGGGGGGGSGGAVGANGEFIMLSPCPSLRTDVA